MAFFKQIGKRITDVSQGVAQQTRNLTDITRLNAKIAEKKETMSQLLFEMGHDYYQKHRKDTDCEEQEYVDRLNALFLEIMKCQDEVELLKAPNTCKACGARLAEGASICMNCGARLSGVVLRTLAYQSANFSRYSPGVRPAYFLNTREKWLWDEKPK